MRIHANIWLRRRRIAMDSGQGNLSIPGGLGTFAPISDRPSSGCETPGIALFDIK